MYKMDNYLDLIDTTASPVNSSDNFANATIEGVLSPTMPRNIDVPFKERELRRLLIGTNPNICGGDPSIIGTRISVPIIIEKIQNLGYELGDIFVDLKNNNYNSKISAINEINLIYKNLDPQQILACIEYYEENKSKIEEIIAEDRSIDE